MRFGIRLITCLLLLGSAKELVGQEASITIRLVDGRNGRPMGGNRLLVFFSDSQDLRGNRKSSPFVTGKDGIAEVRLDLLHAKWIQVFSDWNHVCSDSPNQIAFSFESIRREGVVAPNTCGKTRAQIQAGTLTIYARPETFLEKMSH